MNSRKLDKKCLFIVDISEQYAARIARLTFGETGNGFIVHFSTLLPPKFERIPLLGCDKFGVANIGKINN